MLVPSSLCLCVGRLALRLVRPPSGLCLAWYRWSILFSHFLFGFPTCLSQGCPFVHVGQGQPVISQKRLEHPWPGELPFSTEESEGGCVPEFRLFSALHPPPGAPMAGSVAGEVPRQAGCMWLGAVSELPVPFSALLLPSPRGLRPCTMAPSHSCSGLWLG